MTDPAVIDAISDLTANVHQLTESVGKAWPLDKRETFAAFILMGLASRLQPLHLNDRKAAQILAPLSFDLAELAVAESAKRSEPK